MAESAVVKQKYPEHQTACVPGIFKDVATPLNDFLPLFPHGKRGEENRIRDTMLTHSRLRQMRTQYRREQAPALRLQKNFTVGAIHESPVIICKRIVCCD